MKTIEITVYSYEELSDKAKDKAYYKWLEHHDYFWASENEATLKAFIDIFPVKVSDWSYGGQGEGVSWSFTHDDNIAELTGVRLASYLWNNYRRDLFKGKYYHTQAFGLTDHKIKHPRVKSEQITNKCPNQGKWSNSYYSAILLEHSCVLTGYCIDESILAPIYAFLDKPDSRTFYDLLDECFAEWVKDCSSDAEYCSSQEFFADECDSNGWEFNERGEMI